MPRRTAKRTTAHGKRPNRPRNSLPIYDCSHGIPKGCGKTRCIVVINGHRKIYDPAKHGNFHGWLKDAWKTITGIGAKVGQGVVWVGSKIKHHHLKRKYGKEEGQRRYDNWSRNVNKKLQSNPILNVLTGGANGSYSTIDYHKQ